MPVVLVRGVKGQAEQPLLKRQAVDAIGDIEERLGQEFAIPVDDLDPARALDDEEAAAIVRRRGDINRIGQPVGDLDQLDLWIPRERPAVPSSRGGR